MKTIKIDHRNEILLDDEDYDYASQFKWHRFQGRARRKDKIKNKWPHLHREIMGAGIKDTILAINGNYLDCRKENLKVASRSDVTLRSATTRSSDTNTRGVYLAPSGRYFARFYYQGKANHLGAFDTIAQASKAYEDARRKVLNEHGLKCLADMYEAT